ncbi:MAG: SGNH/GDSL hydrolase family protein [Burkholderiaceae bacterium]|nr:SGNH/GDSL hydrolase family protein [Burkholderiaceae bacterium]MDZ4160992.1 SGNH/GDSL hydrolase family protein [Burkholderiales bacterium]
MFFLPVAGRALLRMVSLWALSGLAAGAQATLVDADHPHIQYLGRVSLANPKAPAFSWTGVSVRLRFTGPSISIRLRDSSSRYSVVIDGIGRGVVEVRADQEEYILAEDLGEGVHELQLIRRHESHWHKAEFLGVRLSRGHSLLPPPARSALRMEFIGDSYVACYGCESDRREGDDGDYLRFTNVSRSFGALVAKHYGAEAMVLAYSGKGLVRNSIKDTSGRTFRPYYERTLHVGEDLGWPAETWSFASWVPRLVVIHLGINDFVGDSAQPALPETFVARYEQFLQSLRVRYSGARFVLMSLPEWPYGLLRPAVEKVIRLQEAAGHQDVVHLHYDLQGEALHWHPSVKQHEEIAARLIELIDREKMLR